MKVFTALLCLLLIPLEAHAQYGMPTGVPSATSLPPAPLPSISPTPIVTLTPPPLPPTPTFSCDTIENIALDAYDYCSYLEQECAESIAALNSLCAGLPPLDECDPISNPNCDICRTETYTTETICRTADAAHSSLGWVLRGYLPEYINQGCMGCYLDIAGVNVYDPCVYNSPRAALSNCTP